MTLPITIFSYVYSKKDPDPVLFITFRNPDPGSYIQCVLVFITKIEERNAWLEQFYIYIFSCYNIL